MINVVTVHWKSDKWIDPQLAYLDRNIDEPYRVYAALRGVIVVTGDASTLPPTSTATTPRSSTPGQS